MESGQISGGTSLSLSLAGQSSKKNFTAPPSLLSLYVEWMEMFLCKQLPGIHVIEVIV